MRPLLCCARRASVIFIVIFAFVFFSSAAHAERGPTPKELYYADAFADHYGVPRALVYAIITQESGWNPDAVSVDGAEGIMQLMPSTAARFGVENPFSLLDNLRGGVEYLSVLMGKFPDLREVVAAYYCGAHHIARSRLNYSNPGVIAYVRSVRRIYIGELDQEAADEQ